MLYESLLMLIKRSEYKITFKQDNGLL